MGGDTDALVEGVDEDGWGSSGSEDLEDYARWED